MKEYDINYCLNCNVTSDDLSLDGENIKLTYYQGLLLCQSCIEEVDYKDKFSNDNIDE